MPASHGQMTSSHYLRLFLRSMIPHHSGAILMCAKAPLRDAEIQRLCKTIIAGQADEIRQMKDKLAALSQ